MSKQAMRALKEANRVRLHRAEIKRKVRAGEMTVAEALEDPGVLHTSKRGGGVTLSELLQYQHRWGPWRAEWFCRRMRYDPQELVAEMTGWQRHHVGEALR